MEGVAYIDEPDRFGIAMRQKQLAFEERLSDCAMYNNRRRVSICHSSACVLNEIILI